MSRWVHVSGVMDLGHILYNYEYDNNGKLFDSKRQKSDINYNKDLNNIEVSITSYPIIYDKLIDILKDISFPSSSTYCLLQKRQEDGEDYYEELENIPAKVITQKNVNKLVEQEKQEDLTFYIKEFSSFIFNISFDMPNVKARQVILIIEQFIQELTLKGITIYNGIFLFNDEYQKGSYKMEIENGSIRTQHLVYENLNRSYKVVYERSWSIVLDTHNSPTTIYREEIDENYYEGNEEDKE